MHKITVINQKVPFQDFALSADIFQTKISVAGVTTLIKSGNKRVINNLKTGLKPIISNKKPDLQVEVKVDKKLKAFVPSKFSVKINQIKNAFLMEHNDFLGKIDLKKRTGKVIVLNETADLSGSFLSLMYSVFFPHFDGFLFHSGAFIKEGKAHVFFGKSESGKSTIIEANSKKHTKINDELNVIRKQKNEYYIFKYPFGKRIKNLDLSAKIASFCTLKKNSNTFLKKTDPALFVSAFLGSVICLNPEQKVSEKLLKISTRITRTVPFYEFNFSREKPFLEGIKIV